MFVHPRRIAAVAFLIVLAIVGLSIRLYDLQVVNGASTATLSEQNRVLRLPVEAERGIHRRPQRQGARSQSARLRRDGDPRRSSTRQAGGARASASASSSGASRQDVSKAIDVAARAQSIRAGEDLAAARCTRGRAAADRARRDVPGRARGGGDRSASTRTPSSTHRSLVTSARDRGGVRRAAREGLSRRPISSVAPVSSPCTRSTCAVGTAGVRSSATRRSARSSSSRTHRRRWGTASCSRSTTACRRSSRPNSKRVSMRTSSRRPWASR